MILSKQKCCLLLLIVLIGLKHFGQYFNFHIFIKLFIHKVKKTSKLWVLGLYLFNKYQ